MNITIRKAFLEDSEALTEILISSWKSAYNGLIPDDALEKNTNLEKRTKMFEMMLSNPSGEFYIVFDGTKPCGHFMFSKSRDADLIDYAEIVAIYTLEECWGKGVGNMMMKKAFEDISNLGYNKAFLWVLKDNLRAIKFYEKNGFVFDGAVKNSGFSDDIWVVRLVNKNISRRI